MIELSPLNWLGQGALIEPEDRELHDAAVEFCKRELAEDVNLSKLSKVWIARDGKEVLGICGYVLVPDVPVFRATREDALRLLADRYNSFLSDNGARMTFIHVARNEKPNQKCPGWKEVLRDWGAKLADRVVIKVR